MLLKRPWHWLKLKSSTSGKSMLNCEVELAMQYCSVLTRDRLSVQPNSHVPQMLCPLNGYVPEAYQA